MLSQPLLFWSNLPAAPRPWRKIKNSQCAKKKTKQPPKTHTSVPDCD